MDNKELFDAFSYCKLSISPLIGLNETAEALKLLQLTVSNPELSACFRSMGSKEINFSQFSQLVSSLQAKNSINCNLKMYSSLFLNFFFS
jgi:hypothetical protein